MRDDGYNHFCPVAKACDILEPRWTMLILCELWSGSTRFNDIRRGVPGVSPTLLSKRLKDMELNGLVIRRVSPQTGDSSYTTSPVADELQPIVEALGKWAHRNIDAEVTLEHLDARLLMWNMRRKINSAALPKAKQSVIQFIFPELQKDSQNYWLVAKAGKPVDLCMIDPRHDVDLFVTADLKALTAAWMGYSTLQSEISKGKIVLVGDRELTATIGDWMVRSSYALDDKREEACIEAALFARDKASAIAPLMQSVSKVRNLAASRAG